MNIEHRDDDVELHYKNMFNIPKKKTLEEIKKENLELDKIYLDRLYIDNKKKRHKYSLWFHSASSKRSFTSRS